MEISYVPLLNKMNANTLKFLREHISFFFPSCFDGIIALEQIESFSEREREIEARLLTKQYVVFRFYMENAVECLRKLYLVSNWDVDLPNEVRY